MTERRRPGQEEQNPLVPKQIAKGIRVVLQIALGAFFALMLFELMKMMGWGKQS